MRVESFRKQVPIPLYDKSNAKASFKSDATAVLYGSGPVTLGTGLLAESAEMGIIAGGAALVFGLAAFGLLYTRDIYAARRKELKRIIERAGNLTSGRKRGMTPRMKVG